MATVKVNVNFDSKRIQKKFEALQDDDKMMLEIHTTFARMINPWVPYLHGPLSQTVEIEPHCVRYIQPYARRQYYGLDFNHTKDVHPLASAMWDKVAMETQRDSFVKQVSKIVKRRARQTWWTRIFR